MAQCQEGLLAGDRLFGPKEGIPGLDTSPLAGVLTGALGCPSTQGGASVE